MYTSEYDVGFPKKITIRYMREKLVLNKSHATEIKSPAVKFHVQSKIDLCHA